MPRSRYRLARKHHVTLGDVSLYAMAHFYRAVADTREDPGEPAHYDITDVLAEDGTSVYNTLTEAELDDIHEQLMRGD